MEKPFDKFANTKIFIIKPSKNSVLNSVHLQHSKKGRHPGILSVLYGAVKL